MKACITLATQREITMPNEKLIFTTNDGFTGEQRVQYQALFALKRFELAELKALASK
ncbi:hypothetical protein [Pseudomonas sp. R9.37]|uniref:hypothetical protein n=1 Tax=Pseudomonas sp. R9.37 TaxID=1390498 RepID=UPI001304B083|nr:hypothetical protein [Pseudomonas sp. R9.37]